MHSPDMNDAPEGAPERPFHEASPPAAGGFGAGDRLKSVGDFRRVYGRGYHASGDRFGCYVAPTRLPRSRLGISVSRKFGNSPERNRMKRQVREAFRRLRRAFPHPIDVVVVPRRAARGMSLGAVAEEIDRLVRRALAQRRRRS